MSGPWVVAELAAWLAAAVLMASGVAIGRGYRHWRQDLLDLDPGEREKAIVGFVAMPWVVTGVLVAACFLPSLADWIGVAADHCLEHLGSHLHLCFHHAGDLPRSGTVGILGGLAAIGAIGLAGAAVREAVEWRRILGNLGALAIPATEPGVFRLATERPLVFTVGFLGPRIYLSDGLRTLLGGEDLEVVLAHEGAHVARRDGLRKLIVSALGVALPPSTRRRILLDFDDTCEHLCDEQAALAVGDTARVARTLLRVARLEFREAPATPEGSVHGAPGATGRRVRSLLEGRPPVAGSRWSLALGALAVSVGLLGTFASGPLHHVAETGLALLFF